MSVGKTTAARCLPSAQSFCIWIARMSFQTQQCAPSLIWGSGCSDCTWPHTLRCVFSAPALVLHVLCTRGAFLYYLCASCAKQVCTWAPWVCFDNYSGDCGQFDHNSMQLFWILCLPDFALYGCNCQQTQMRLHKLVLRALLL